MSGAESVVETVEEKEKEEIASVRSEALGARIKCSTMQKRLWLIEKYVV